MDLRDFFRLIHEISGLNVVLDPNVKGTLTIVLDEVPWDQALDIVLQNNSLEKQLHGNVLRIATLETIKKEADTARDVRKAENDAQEMVTVPLGFSLAEMVSGGSGTAEVGITGLAARLGPAPFALTAYTVNVYCCPLVSPAMSSARWLAPTWWVCPSPSTT